MFNVAAQQVSIAAHENLTPLFSFCPFAVNICDSSLVDFFVLCSTAVSVFWMFQLFFLVECEWLEITQESRKMQASPRADVDEAPYAPGNDLLYVTELEDAHDSIKLLKSDDNLEFLYPETLSILNSDETSGQ